MAGRTTVPVTNSLIALCSLLALLVSALLAAITWPTWIKNSMLGEPPTVVWKSEAPQDILQSQLLTIDAARSPSSASALHAALAKLLDSSGQQDEALTHYMSARDYALAAMTVPAETNTLASLMSAGEQKQALVEARIALGRAYLERGRAEEAEAELEKDWTAATMVALDDAHLISMFQTMAKARRELGQFDSALRLSKLARQHLEKYVSKDSDSVSSQEYIAVLSDIGGIHVQLGRHDEALEPLRKALETLDTPSSLGMIPGSSESHVVKPELAIQLHGTMGDALCASGDSGEAMLHYRKAVAYAKNLQHSSQKHIAHMEEKMRNLRQQPQTQPKGREKPELEPMRGTPHALAKGPNDAESQVESASDLLATMPLSERVDALLRKGQSKEAEANCLAVLERGGGSMDSNAIASAQIALGKVYRRERRLPEASKVLLDALSMVIRAEMSEHIEEVYKNLGVVQVMLHSQGKSDLAEAILRDATSRADAAAFAADNALREKGEFRLRANAFPSVVLERPM